MYYPILRPGAQHQLKKIGEADLVIGLPSYKNAANAATVARIALEGAHEYYPHLRTVLVNADAGTEATTRKAVAAQAFTNGHNSSVVSGRYSGALGHGSATAAIFDAALALDAKAIVILDTASVSLTPRWIAGLAHLILNDKAELVLPRYRQWLLPTGYFNDLIMYPFIRALWGWSVRHPAVPDFAVSSQLAALALDEDIWGTTVATFGLSTWLATTALAGGWRVAQSALGHKQEQETSSAMSKDFQTQFQDVLSVMFSMAYRCRDCLKLVERFESLPTLTEFASTQISTPLPEQDIDWLLDNLALGWMEYRSVWQYILTPDNLAQIEGLAALPPDRFYFPPDLWARIIYDYTVGFNKAEADPAKIINSLFPLFQGRLAAFWQEVAGLAFVGREGTVAAQAVDFEEARPYLKIRWSAFQP